MSFMYTFTRDLNDLIPDVGNIGSLTLSDGTPVTRRYGLLQFLAALEANRLDIAQEICRLASAVARNEQDKPVLVSRDLWDYCVTALVSGRVRMLAPMFVSVHELFSSVACHELGGTEKVDETD